MVLFRPLLGIRGSYLPSILNVVQLVGWTAFELWAMAVIAARVGGDLLGVTLLRLLAGPRDGRCARSSPSAAPSSSSADGWSGSGCGSSPGSGLWITIALFAGGHVHGFWSNVGVPGASFWVLAGWTW